MPDQMLSDVKVIDISHDIAGPYLTKVMADYGADVIKIENPDGGDVARRRGPFPGNIPHPEKSGTFLYLNTNKRSITLNLATGTGRRILRELAKDADVLVENFEPQKMQDWGLTYDSFKAVNPDLVMTSISNFGQWGPYRDFKANEIVIWAMGGPMCGSGRTGREPLKIYDTASAYQVALDALVPTMAAFIYARQTGVGQQIDVSAMEAMVSSLDRRAQYILAHVYSGRLVTYRITETPTGVLPMLGYPTQDGFIQFTWSNVTHFSRFADWIGHPELKDDPEFNTAENRMRPEQRGIIEAMGMSFFLDHTMAELMTSMEQYQIPGGCVYTIKEAVDDPAPNARGFFVEIDHPAAGTFRYPSAPARPRETPWQLRWPAPLLGQHNEEVYCGLLGYSKQDLVLLRAQNVI